MKPEENMIPVDSWGSPRGQCSVESNILPKEQRPQVQQKLSRVGVAVIPSGRKFLPELVTVLQAVRRKDFGHRGPADFNNRATRPGNFRN